MSKLEELIQKYCPDGVEYYPLCEVFEMRNGYTPSTTNGDYWDGGAIPWFKMEDIRAQGRILSDSVLHITSKAIKGKGLFKANSIILATSATIGEHALVLVNHLANQRFTNLYPIKQFQEKVDMFFMNYYFHLVDNWCQAHINQGSFASVDMEQLRNLQIPIPPLPVQEEIVRVLDTFTELQAELQAELQKRLQQYNYYRDNLLSFEGREDVEWKTISSVAQVCRGVRVVKSQLSNEGYPVFQNCLTPMGFFSKTNCPGGTPFVICGGAAGNVGYTNVDCWAADDCEYIVAGQEISGRFIYHCLMVKKDYLSSKVRKASIPRLSPSVIKDLVIPVPSLAEQQKIVDVLDRFDAMTTDLAAGLPAEIEKRRQQYEYYRDQLLTFKRAN